MLTDRKEELEERYDGEMRPHIKPHVLSLVNAAAAKRKPPPKQNNQDRAKARDNRPRHIEKNGKIKSHVKFCGAKRRPVLFRPRPPRQPA
jgi:hypothetical protein